MIPSLRKIVTACILTVITACVWGQNNTSIGKFNNHFFSINEFGSAPQIWTGTQGSDGVAYFGNDQEILAYNGSKWRKIRCNATVSGKKNAELVKNTKVSKLYTSKKGVTYVGRQDNFGYLAYSDSGFVYYKPLVAMPPEQGIGQIWDIFENRKGEVILIAKNKIFTVNGEKVSEVKMPQYLSHHTCRTSGIIGDGILLIYSRDVENLDDHKEAKKDKKFLYLDLKTMQLKEIFLPEHIELFNLRGTVEINGKWYLFNSNGDTYSLVVKDGKFFWNSPNEDIFPSLKYYAKTRVKRIGSSIFLSTENHGLVVCDLTGKITRMFDLYDGMQSINVFDFFHDNEGNLWLNMDNGVHFFETSSPLTYFDKTEGITARIENIDFGSGRNLMATGSDIFVESAEPFKKTFKSTNAVEEQCFDVDTYETSFGKKTIVIGYNGIYEIDANFKKTTISEAYAWTSFQNPSNKDEIFLGMTSSLGKLTRTKSGWKFEEVIPDLGGDVINISSLGNKLYFGVKGQGVCIYDIYSHIHRFVKLPGGGKTTSHFYVETFQDKVFVGVESGLFVLSRLHTRLLPFKEINGKLNSDQKLQIHRIYNQNDEKLWLVVYRDKSDSQFEIETGWLENKGKWTWTTWPLSGLESGGIVFTINQAPNGEVWLGSNSGLYVLNSHALKKFRKQFKVGIDQITTNGKTRLYSPEHAKPLGDVAYKDNTMRFEFYAKSFNSIGAVKYRYHLIGLTDGWSEWSDLNYIDFPKIPGGSYTLKIQAQNAYGITSDTLSYSFTVLPPWYQTWLAYVFYVIVLFFLIYLIIRLSTQRVKRQNQKLEEIVVERTREIAAQNQQLEQQKTEITQKTNDIVDSIKYAKRIQNTILPSEERLERLFADHFVFYRPKDIVSGDFYWARKVKGKCVFSAIDCTGHGVPGALVSIVGNNGLLRCVNEFNLIEPNDILDKLRDVVVGAFKSQGQTDVKDGMDMALCTIDPETMTLKYAGANNECVVIRGTELFELKPDKQPIGQFTHAKPFSQHEFQLQPGDCIYLFTDGYVDQFGGEKSKKFKSRPFKNMLLEIQQLTMENQYEKIKQAFDDWKGELEQVDDVCVFGVRV